MIWALDNETKVLTVVMKITIDDHCSNVTNNISASSLVSHVTDNQGGQVWL